MPVFDPARLQIGRVVAHHGQDGEAQGFPGVLIGPIPDGLGRLGPRSRVQAHTLALNALAREGVDSLRRGGTTGRGHHQITTGAAGDLDDLVARVDSDPFHPHIDIGTRPHHPEEPGGPRGQGARRHRRLRVHRRHRVLRGGRQPHPVHDRTAQAGELRRGIAGVDGVVVTGDRGERGHAPGGDHGDVPAPAARCLGGVLAHGPRGPRRIGQLTRAGAAADGEPFGQPGQRHHVQALVAHLTDRDLHLDHPAEIGIDHGTGNGAHHENAGLVGEFAQQLDPVVEMHQIQHALDHAGVGLRARRAEYREHRGPAGAHQHIRHGTAQGAQIRGQPGTGDAAVIGDQIRRPGQIEVRDSALHLGQRLSGGHAQQCGHRHIGIGFGHYRRAAVVHRHRHRDADTHRLSRIQRHGEFHVVVLGLGPVGLDEGGSGRRVHRTLLVHRPLVQVTETVHRVHGGPARPVHIGRGQHHIDRAAGHRGDPAGVDGRGRHTVADQFVGGVLLEAVQQFAHRLVHPGDPGDRDGARDDADLVGGVPRIVGLPQRIRTPPAAHVLIHHRHEVDRLTRGFAQGDEERHIRGVQHRLRRRGVALAQSGECGGRIFQILVAEQRFDLTAIGRREPGLGAAQHLGEPVPPADVQPHRLGGRGDRVAEIGTAVEILAAFVSDREVHIAFEPGEVGHGRGIAEVGLGGRVQRGDDLGAALGHRVGVPGHFVEQATGPRGGIVDLVDIGAQLAAARGHSAVRGTRAHPVRGAGGVDQQLFHLGCGRGLQRGHGRGTHQHTVERHGRVTVRRRPGAGQVFGGPLRGPDPATDADHDISVGAQFGIGFEQEIVQVLPGVVPAGPTTLDVHDHRVVGHLVGDPEHRADLRDRARFERDVADPRLGQFLDQRDGFLELRDTGGDDHTVERSARRACSLNQPLTPQLQFPQVRVQEQRIELHLPSRVQQFLQIRHAVGEDLLGHLATTGQFRPVAGIGRGRDDLRVHRGRGHPRQQNGRAPGELGERGLHHDPAVGQPHRARRERGPRPRDLRGGARGQQMALTGPGGRRNDADTGALQRITADSGEQVAGAEVQNPFGTGGHHVIDGRDPVDGLDQDVACQLPGEFGIEPALPGPAGDQFDGIGERRVVERDVDLEILEDRREHRPAALFGRTLPVLLGVQLRTALLHAAQLVGSSGQDHPAPAVADRQHRGHHRVHARRDLGEHGAQFLGIDVGHRDHRRPIPDRHQPASPRDQSGSGADQLGDRENLRVLLSGRPHRGSRQQPLRMADHRDRCDLGRVQSLQSQRAQGRQLGQQHTRHRYCRRTQHPLRRRVRGFGLVVGEIVLQHPGDGVESHRTHRQQLIRDGFQQCGRLVHEGGEFGLQGGVTADLGQFAQPAGALSAERERVRGSFPQPIQQRRAIRLGHVPACGHIHLVSGSGRSALVDRQDASTFSRGDMSSETSPAPSPPAGGPHPSACSQREWHKIMRESSRFPARAPPTGGYSCTHVPESEET